MAHGSARFLPNGLYFPGLNSYMHCIAWQRPQKAAWNGMQVHVGVPISVWARVTPILLTVDKSIALSMQLTTSLAGRCIQEMFQPGKNIEQLHLHLLATIFK